MFSNKVYDILKWVALVAMPALIALFGVIGATLQLGCTQQVITIATAVNACLGTMLGISSVTYNARKDD